MDVNENILDNKAIFRLCIDDMIHSKDDAEDFLRSNQECIQLVAMNIADGCHHYLAPYRYVVMSIACYLCSKYKIPLIPPDGST